MQRPLWRHYYQNSDALIFVIDSNDRDRLSECKDELWRFLQEDELKDSVLLIMANKQDLPNALSTQEITEKLELNSIRNRKWCKYSNQCRISLISHATHSQLSMLCGIIFLLLNLVMSGWCIKISTI